MAAAAVPLMIGGTLLQYSGYRQAGRAARIAGQRQRQAAEFEAEQLEIQSGQSIAAAQRRMLEERRQARLAQSRAQAVAAASGGGASDITVVNLISRIAAEGAYKEEIALYEGMDRSRQLRMAAKSKRFEGASAEQAGAFRQSAYDTMALGSLVGGAGSLFGKYGGGGPKGDMGLLDDG